MLNFSGLSNTSRIGRALRIPLNLVPKSAVLPILQGPLRGQRWIAGASNHGCWLGSYELEKQRSIAGILRQGMVVYDLGANVGFYSLLFSREVGKHGQVYAFEPVRSNQEHLERHLLMNHCRNVELLGIAVSDVDGTARFQEHESNSMGKLSSTGATVVECAAIDTLVESGRLRAPDVMKIDVEGAETLVLRGAKRTLDQHRPIIFLATHGASVHLECCRLLESLGYFLKSLDDNKVESSAELLAISA